MALLELTDVRAGYGVVEALHGISLAVDEGEVVTLEPPDTTSRDAT